MIVKSKSILYTVIWKFMMKFFKHISFFEKKVHFYHFSIKRLKK